jgi:DUF1365 family protein
MTGPAARLWFGKTRHVRERPFHRAFSHSIAMIELDLRRLPEAEGMSRLFSIGRGNMVSFRAGDHGARSPVIPLRAWAEEQFAEAGVRLEGGALRLLTFPRVLGYGFAPISLWYGYGPDDRLRGVIYEVHNTFGETHSYVTAFGTNDVQVRAGKEFHVSPFMDVSGEYRFTLRHGDESMALIVENVGVDGRDHVASMTLRSVALGDGAILKWLVTMPISGLGVMVAIHWQAFRLWLKGARYRDKPEQRAKRTTLALPEETFAGAREDLRKRA